jgi:hypothetical protein
MIFVHTGNTRKSKVIGFQGITHMITTLITIIIPARDTGIGSKDGTCSPSGSIVIRITITGESETNIITG